MRTERTRRWVVGVAVAIGTTLAISIPVLAADNRQRGGEAVWASPGQATAEDDQATGQDSVEQAAFRPLLRRRVCPPCPPQYEAAAPTPAVPQPAPGVAPPAKPGEAAAPQVAPPEALASAMSPPGGTLATAPNMIGDLFGASTLRGWSSGIMGSYYPPQDDFIVPNPANGGVVGRTKIAENTSAMPQDRLLFNYSYFDRAPLFPGGVQVHRFTPGIEKTFFNGMGSIELKIPMASTLDSTIVADGGTDLSHGEFGNMMITPKVLLTHTDSFAAALGMSISVPTANDVVVALSDGSELLRIDNQSVFLAPFLGIVWTYDQFFVQGFLQYDVDANGSPVVESDQFSQQMREIGRLRGNTFQYLDIAGGWWTYRSGSPYDLIQGVALTGEVHWNRSLDKGRNVFGEYFGVGDFREDIQILDLTVGTHIELRNNTTVSVGYSVPVGNRADQQFDGELRVMVNHFYGPFARPGFTMF